VRNRSNNWGFDPHEQKSLTYTGMGLDINVHDQWAVEAMGAIQDRTKEHLGVSDRAITANRRLLLRSLKSHASGAPTPGTVVDQTDANALRGPVAIDMIGSAAAWRTEWTQREADRRAGSPWAHGYAASVRELQTS
jgi:hypothetical protein